jgi:RNA polymerase sigma factor (sigma-70 family)
MIERLINRLMKDNSLTTATAHIYLRRALFTFFAMRGAASPDEMVAETINRVARRLSEGAQIAAENPSSYFYAMARNVWRESLASPNMPLSLPDDDLAAGSQAAPPDPVIGAREQIESEARSECLEKCLGQFNTEERELIVSYYRFSVGERAEKRKRLAARLGMSGNALGQKVARLRGRLAECINDCRRSQSHPDLK